MVTKPTYRRAWSLASLFIFNSLPSRRELFYYEIHGTSEGVVRAALGWTLLRPETKRKIGSTDLEILNTLITFVHHEFY